MATDNHNEKANAVVKLPSNPVFKYLPFAPPVLIPRQAAHVRYMRQGRGLEDTSLACHPHCNASAPTLAAVMTEMIVALLPHQWLK